MYYLVSVVKSGQRNASEKEMRERRWKICIFIERQIREDFVWNKVDEVWLAKVLAVSSVPRGEGGVQSSLSLEPWVFAIKMADITTNAHMLVCMRILVPLKAHLRRRRCFGWQLHRFRALHFALTFCVHFITFFISSFYFLLLFLLLASNLYSVCHRRRRGLCGSLRLLRVRALYS